MIMDAGIKKEIEQNREILSPIIDSVIFCGRLGLPLRGHRDDSKYHPTVGCYSSGGVGNFIETLNYGVRRGDKVLENHLKNCGKNRSYISKTSQNKIIKCCGQVISNQIISDIKKRKFFSVIADEASDSSYKEQMSLVLRFVDTDMNIREEFISFLFCKWRLSGAQLAKLLLEALKELTLSIDDCRGQGYDGAGSVAGCTNGLAAQILKLNPKALYTHCYSHRLNLSICDSLSIRVVNDMLKHVNNATNFIKISQTRNIPLKNIYVIQKQTRKRLD
ncbi:52 kDa repressor of the inhibitor of the protein kinase-like [Xenia sp. Carnegie-2017]|uniref:52 kDa repressor of the inhibitor of the protein kinase-like n=1 Tax=Xenia sp. Carnegie-2017 TaxID=2897299 RepID=UPI001F03E320|nr:52 kDa repressor of the inhibitor of the protein kinase-like [Xenia sp. Carnegie-2017]